MKISILIGLLLCCCGSVWAEQAKIPDYETARKLFWKKLYASGGQTLYCGQNFGAGYNKDINIEHVFPMSWVTRELGCAKRHECRQNSERFNRIEADLHNLYPARVDINDERSSFPFAEIKGEQPLVSDCDFEFDGKRRVVEPRPKVRGEIARAMFYMARTYGLRIHKKQGRMLKKWHFQDNPSKAEKHRNDLIEQIQGTRNPFVDDPQQANNLAF